jgi:probable biosynthetic protein (TIGR04098 family)
VVAVSFCLFECDYEILAPHDINGVGLLYFAAYPMIFDLCLERHEGKGFLMAHSTVSKDMFYFANSEPSDTLVFRLHAREQEGGRIGHLCSLSRKSDGKRMAEVTASRQRIAAWGA